MGLTSPRIRGIMLRGNYRICLFCNVCLCEEDVWRMMMIINEEIEVIKGFVKPFIEILELQNPRACAPPEKQAFETLFIQ